MDAFGRWYSILDSENKSIEHFDIYTSEYIYKYIKKDKWDLMDPPAVNLLAAIPIIYYYRRRPLCNDINDLVKRFAETISNFCDTNDYFGSPTLVINGTVISLADKKNSGKVIQLEGQATANYLIWPQAPESIKLELSTLKELIFTMVQCADISFEQMKGLGGASGIAIERMLTDIYLKCNMEERKFGEGIQRRLNLFKEAIGNIIAVGLKNDADNMAIKPIFNYYKPNNIADLVQMLTNANGGKPIVSQKTAVGLSPLTQDPAIELEQIQAEESASIDTNLQPASFNP
jgi:SPP1 family phage portal protein